MSTSAGDTELIVVAYRSRPQVEQLFAGLPAELPVAVVDNSDDADDLAALVTARPRGRYLTGGGVGFARAANLGARTSTAEYVVFVNPDTGPTAAQLATLVEDVATDSGLSASAGMLVDDGHGQIGIAGWEPSLARVLVHSLGLHKVLPRAGLFAVPGIGEDVDVDWVSGACMAVRRSTFVDLGCFDEDFYVYNEDMEFGRASRERGLRQRLRTDVTVPGASGGSGAPSLEMWRLRGASMVRYLRKHHTLPSAASMAAGLALGYAARAVLARGTGDAGRAKEYWAYTAGALTGRATVGGRVVVAR